MGERVTCSRSNLTCDEAIRNASILYRRQHSTLQHVYPCPTFDRRPTQAASLQSGSLGVLASSDCSFDCPATARIHTQVCDG